MAKATEEKMIAVRVAARPIRGFHRAGRYWPPEATDAEVTEAQLKVIESSPDLVCVRFPPGVSIEKTEEIATAKTETPAAESAPPPPPPPPATGKSEGKGRSKAESGSTPQG